MSQKTNRREFLKAGLITTAAAMTAGPGIILTPDFALAQTYPGHRHKPWPQPARYHQERC